MKSFLLCKTKQNKTKQFKLKKNGTKYQIQAQKQTLNIYTDSLLEREDRCYLDRYYSGMDAKTMRCQGSQDEEKAFKMNFMESYILLWGF